MDVPELSDHLLTEAAEALHQACCGGVDIVASGVDYADELRRVDDMAHRHDALVVLDAVHAELHAATLRWAADRIRTGCSPRDDDYCCEQCARYATWLNDWADAAAPPDAAERPPDGPATPTRTTGTNRGSNPAQHRQEAQP
jgi:hypothetical protein